MRRTKATLNFMTFFRVFFLLTTILLGALSCKQDSKQEEAIAKIEIDFQLARFDREFDAVTEDNLGDLKTTYPYFFSSAVADTTWLAKVKDTLQQELRDEVNKAFKGFTSEKEELTSFFKHVKYYFSGSKIPKVITMTNDVDYENRVIWADTLLLLGLDNYLGEEHHFYQRISRYIAKKLNQKYLVPDVASAFSKTVQSYPRDRRFIARMLYYGKELYLKDLVLPHFKDADKIGYTDQELQWAQENEEQIWRYFIEEQLLYSTDATLDKRFLDPAPFSKFQLELDSESPGGLGRYIGWQIVRAYMDKTQISLPELMVVPAEELFRKSNYKPKR